MFVYVYLMRNVFKKFFVQFCLLGPTKNAMKWKRNELTSMFENFYYSFNRAHRWYNRIS